MTPEEFSGHLPSINSDDRLAVSGATLDDGSNPGSVTVAFIDPELTAMQANAAGVVANSGSGSTIAESNPPGDMTSGAIGNGISGSTGNLALNSESLTNEPSYQFFLNDGSGGNPGDVTASTSGNVALNAGPSADPPLYDYFLDNASDGSAGLFSSGAMGDVSLFSNTIADPGKSNPTDDQLVLSTSFPDLPQGNIPVSLPGTDVLATSNPDPNLFNEATNVETPNSEPNLFTEGSDPAGFSSDPSLSTQGSDLAMFSSDPSIFTQGSDLNVATLPAEGGTQSSISGSNSGLFADSLSAGSDLFSNVARKVRRQELQNPYPGLDGWTKTRLRRRRGREMGKGS